MIHIPHGFHGSLKEPKTRWLCQGEDDLKFLYGKLRVRNNTNYIKGITTDGRSFYLHNENSLVIIDYLNNIYNTNRSNIDIHKSFPLGFTISSILQSKLWAPFSDKEINIAVFTFSKNSTPCSDAFTVEFFSYT